MDSKSSKTVNRAPSGPLLAFLQLLLLLSVAKDVTVIPNVIAEGIFPRTIFFIALVFVAFALLVVNGTAALFIAKQKQIIMYALLFLGPYLFVVMVESINAIFTGRGQFNVLLLYVFMGTLIPSLFFMYLLGGGGGDEDKGLVFILRPYVYLCLYISVTGVLASGLTHFGLVEGSEWPPPSFVGEKIARRAGEGIGGQLYSMPYYLSFVWTGAEHIGHLATYPVGGLSSEPHVASFFVSPALFAIPFVFKESGVLVKSLLCLVTLLFLFLTFSVTNIVALTVIGLLLVVSNPSVVRPGMKKLVALFCVAVVMSLLFLMIIPQTLGPLWYIDYVLWKWQSISGIVFRGFFESMFSSDSLFGFSIFVGAGEERLTEEPPYGIFSYAAIFFQITILFILGLRLFFSGRRTAVLGLSLVYVVIHSLKGPGKLFYPPFFLFLLCIGIFAYMSPGRRSFKVVGP